MKFSRILRVSAVITVAVFTFGTAQALSPDQQFGVGVSVFGSTAASLTNVSSLVYGAYALNPGLHIGAGFSFSSVSEKVAPTNVKVTSSVISLTPYGKFLFMGPNATLKPFAQVALNYTSIEGSASMALVAAGGGEYFVNRNLGIQAGVTLLTFELSDEDGGSEPIDSGFGFLNASVGVEWFF